MKRRNAESGKMRRPIKRTKISEAMCVNSLWYMQFVMLWSAVVMVDYILEFRIEYVWPFWLTMKSLCRTFKHQGLAFSVFFVCIMLSSDIICFFFIPVQWIFIAASTYVWIQYLWYSVADKGICLPTVAICCFIIYIEGILRSGDRGGGLAGGGLEFSRPFATHCIGYPIVLLGFGVKTFVEFRIKLRRQKKVQSENDVYFRIMREALPESALEQNQTSKEGEKSAPDIGDDKPESEHKHMNGIAGHCPGAVPVTPVTTPTNANTPRSRRERTKHDLNGSCHHDHSSIQINTKVDKQISHSSLSKEKEAKVSNTIVNGIVAGHEPEDDRRDTSRSSAKSPKCDKKDKELSTVKEDKKRSKNKEKDKDNCDNQKSTEQFKESILKEKDVVIESTKENIKVNKENISNKDKERDRERERELREARECNEELKRVKVELAASKSSEEEARSALSAATASDRQRRTDLQQLRQQHTALQQKVQSCRTLERRLSEERRARSTAEQNLQKVQQQVNQRKTGECENEYCRARRTASETESTGLRRELQRVQARVTQLQRDLSVATEQVRTLETLSSESVEARTTEGAQLASAWVSLQERSAHLERSLSAETRVKLDLLSALGEAKRQLHIKENTILYKEKELAELKAQMLAVMPPSTSSGNMCQLRHSDGLP